MTADEQLRGIVDANVLYPAPLRDLLLQLAVSDLFRAKWTADIHREWMEALLRNDPHRDRAALERTRDLMDKATRDCLISGYEAIIPSLGLPDPKDGHVLAAAIIGRCDVIVTHNLKDFPEAVLAPYGIDVQHPDEFLCNHLNLAQGPFLQRGAESPAPAEKAALHDQCVSRHLDPSGPGGDRFRA